MSFARTASPMRLTPREFAERTRFTRRAVYKWLEKGKIKGYREGFRRIMIPESELKKIIGEPYENEEEFFR